MNYPLIQTILLGIIALAVLSAGATVKVAIRRIRPALEWLDLQRRIQEGSRK